MDIDINAILQKVYEYLAQYGFKVIGALLIFLIGRLVAKIISRWIETALLKSRVDKTLAKFIKNLSNIVLLLFVVIAALAPLGVETAQFAVVLGAAGLAIGLALQGSLSNLLKLPELRGQLRKFKSSILLLIPLIMYVR